jgi:hypothetical protein
VLGACLLSASIWTVPAVFGQAYCQDSLISPHLPNGYQRREGRCEGFYEQELRGQYTLTLVSLTVSTRIGHSSTGSRVDLYWKPRTEGSLFLRARPCDYSVPYQMDTRVPVNFGVYSWPISQLRGSGLELGDFCFLAWTHTIQGRAYVPISVGGQPAALAPLYLKFSSGYDLDAVYIRDRFKAETPRELTRLLGFYPSDIPFAVHVPPLEPRGHLPTPIEVRGILLTGKAMIEQFLLLSK